MNDLKKDVNSKAKYVITNNEVVLYKDKEPFVPSGKSVAGAIEYDKDNDQLKCHECGEFVGPLGRHVNKEHKIKSRDYKRKHGLNQSTALVSEKTRIALSVKAKQRHNKEGSPKGWYKPERMARALAAKKRVKHLASAERRNGVMHCKAQLMQKIKDVAKILKRTPSRRELTEYGIPQGSLEYHYGCLANAMKLAGLQPNGNIGRANCRSYSDGYLLRGIRLFHTNWGRLPSATDYKRGMMTASRSTYRGRFGSLDKANKLAFAKEKPSE